MSNGATCATEAQQVTEGVSSAPAQAQDEVLASAFTRRLRNPEALADACVLLVDTSQPGHWPVVWADDTWALWAGFSRTEALGRPLQSLLRPASQGVAPLHWGAAQVSGRAERGCSVGEVMVGWVRAKASRLSTLG
jgi:hypothetical protein